MNQDHDPRRSPRPDRPTGPEIAARMKQTFERHPPERRINWPIAIGVICTAASIAGGMTWAVARAWGL